jgi:rhodanese-related sulfurtransferase
MPPNGPDPQAPVTFLSAELEALGRRLLLVRDLADPLREQILAAGQIQRHRAGTVFCADKRDHDWVHYLVDGIIVATGIDRRARETESSAYGPLDAFHAPGRLNASVRAKTDITVLRIPLSTLSRFVNVAHAISAVALPPDVVELGLDESGDGLELALSTGVLSRLPTHDIQRLLQRVEEVPVRANEIILDQGQTADCCFIVKSGVAEVDIDRYGGTQFRIALKGPGDFFGEEALLMRGPRRATVRMRDDGVLLRITVEDFHRLIAPSYICSVTREAADRMVAEGAVWLDMREPAEFQHGSLPGAVNLPEAILRLRCTSLDPRQRYVVCSSHPEQSALGNFMLTTAGLEAWFLDEAIGVLEATSRIPFARDIDQGPDIAPDLPADDDPLTSSMAPAVQAMNRTGQHDIIKIGLEDVRAAERQRYQRRLRRMNAQLIAEADARVRAAVQEVEVSYLTELENKHRQVLELKRKVALQQREIWKLQQAKPRAGTEFAEADQWPTEPTPDVV